MKRRHRGSLGGATARHATNFALARGFVIGERLVEDQNVLTSLTVGSSWGANLQVRHVSPEYPLRLLACV